jgi:hypothetical protein
MDTRLKEHQQLIRLEHPDTLTVAEHSVNFGHRIQFHITAFLATETRYVDCIVRNTIEIELHPNKMNRETVPDFKKDALAMFL